MSELNPRPRAAAAVLRNGGKSVLMVKNVKPDGSAAWQFPGGGVSAGETLEEAVIRELREETGLVGTNPKKLFALPYSRGISTTFLVEVDENAPAVLGHDPEDEHAAHKKLADLAWMKIADLSDNSEIKALLRCLKEQGEEASGVAHDEIAEALRRAADLEADPSKGIEWSELKRRLGR